jgi:hypothetical protein
MRLLALILALYAAFYAGTMKVPSIQLEGTQWCVFGEYSSLKAYDQARVGADVMVDVHSRGVTVWVRCDDSYR